MACFQFNLPQPPPIPYHFFTSVLLPMIMSLLLCCSDQRSCEASSCVKVNPCTYQDLRTNCSYTFDELQLYLYSTDLPNTRTSDMFECGLSSYMDRMYPNGYNSSYTALLTLALENQLWENSCEGTKHLLEGSFGISFTMGIDWSMTQSEVSMLFTMLSTLQETENPCSSSGPATTMHDTGPATTMHGTSGDIITGAGGTTSGVAGNHTVSVHVSPVQSTLGVVRQVTGFDSYNNSIGIRISIEPLENTPTGSTSVNPTTSTPIVNYSVWIDYDNCVSHLSVFVDLYGNPKPDIPIFVNTKFNISGTTSPSPTLGFYSTVGQLEHLNTWNVVFSNHPDICFYDQQNNNPSNNKIILPAVLGPSVAMVAGIAAVYIYFNSKYRRWKKDLDRLSQSMQRLPGMPTQIQHADIKKATNNFHESMKLGKGGFGAVYRCRLPAPVRGQVLEVAVKKFTRSDNRCYEDFLAEVSVINRLRHKNIVPLIGWSYHKGEALLISEYMTNGSLDRYLSRKDCTTTLQQEDMAFLQWDTRYGIVRDIATGLHYIHHEHEPMVLHRDIKASNIMLDFNFHGRIGDFGIACIVDVNRSSVTGIAGTWGYIGLDYVTNQKATRQTDIYAFGVVVLEIVTGRHWDDVKPDDDHITDWVWRLHLEGHLLDAVDSSVLTAEEDKKEAMADEAERMLLLGLACTHPNPSNRPSMVDVVQVITKLAPPPDVPPERPTFMWPPPEDLRSRNSVYSTAVSNLNGSSVSTVEPVHINQEQPSSTEVTERTLPMIAEWEVEAVVGQPSRVFPRWDITHSRVLRQI